MTLFKKFILIILPLVIALSVFVFEANTEEIKLTRANLCQRVEKQRHGDQSSSSIVLTFPHSLAGWPTFQMGSRQLRFTSSTPPASFPRQ